MKLILLLLLSTSLSAQYAVKAPITDLSRVQAALVTQGFPIRAVSAQELTTDGIQYFVKDTHWENNIYIRVRARIEGDSTVLTADYGFHGGHYRPVLDNRVCRFSKSILDEIVRKL